MKTVEFIFDFVSPNAYFVHRLISEISSRTNSKLIITPVFLAGIMKETGNQPPFQAFAGVKGKINYEMLESRRFIAKHNLNKFVMNPSFPFNSIGIMRAYVAAQKMGVGSRLFGRIFEAIWEDGINLATTEGLYEVIQNAGFDAHQIIELSHSQQIKDELAANTKNAIERGVFGIPSFFVGKELFFGKERLGQIEEMLLPRDNAY